MSILFSGPVSGTRQAALGQSLVGRGRGMRLRLRSDDVSKRRKKVTKKKGAKSKAIDQRSCGCHTG